MTHQAHLPVPPNRATNEESLRAQILATEHWSLLATRGMTWGEIFSRTNTFLTVVSAAVIALSFVAQGSGFGEKLHVIAALVLPVVLLVGLGTFLRLVEADVEDTWLIIGMNRIRHAYLELAPDLEPYFVTSSNDDGPGVMRTYAFRDRVGIGHWLSGSPLLVGLIEATVFGVLAAIVCQAGGAAGTAQMACGVLAGLIVVAALAAIAYRRVVGMSRAFQPRFPGEA
jgi:hypothetical protein